jgi:hypothetical protein
MASAVPVPQAQDGERLAADLKEFVAQRVSIFRRVSRPS